jgi:calcineurin-like phosphoesterase family protein
MYYLTSDLHHRHKNILNVSPKYRPWTSMEEMTEALVEYHNDLVREEDTLIILGDFSFGKTAYTIEVLKRMTGKKIIVRGNHDQWLDKAKQEDLDVAGIVGVHDIFTRRFDGVKVIMCHYAIRAWQDQGRGSIHLFGHSHGSLEGEGRSMDVGWDAQGRYLLMDEAILTLGAKDIVVADHHKIIVES